MKKSDLENGMIVELRNGGKYIVIKDFTSKTERFGGKDIMVGYPNMIGFMDFKNYNDDLYATSGDSEWDIVRVYYRKSIGSSDLVLLWERKGIELTDDERKLLEVVYNQGYKWIARDKHGDTYVYNIKPKKERNYWNNYGKYIRYNRFQDFIIFKDLFTFIKWEDEEPYSIEELLKGE